MFRTLFAFTLTLFLPTASMAAVLTDYSQTFNQNDFDSNGNLTVALPQFDPSVGSLISATLELEGVTGPQFEVLNVGSVAGTGIGSTAVTYLVSGPGVASLFATESSGTQTVTVGGAFLDLASSSPVISPFFPSTTLGDLTAVTGAGTTDFTINQSFTTSGSTLTQGADLAFGGTASANLGLSVTYDYTPAEDEATVPEPASLAVILVGLTGLVAVRRHRG
jgi:hypothetical protein